MSNQNERHASNTRPARARSGMAALANAGENDEFSVIAAIGGVRGVVESMLPGLLFIVLFICTSDLRMTVIASAALAVVQVVVRLIQRQSVMGALGGLVAVGICLFWAWKSGEARNYYMYGFITNAAYIVLLLVSMAVRVPGLDSSWSSYDRCPPSISRRGSTAGAATGRSTRRTPRSHGCG